MRKPLSPVLERKILVKNRHCCCICHKDGIGKEVWIHHIDGNNSNNVLSNLAVLCILHASQADAGLISGKLGAGKKLKPDEVREFKKNWETKIEQENNIQKNIVSIEKREQLEILYFFEINKTKNEILSCEKDSVLIEEKLDFLDQIATCPVRRLEIEAKK
jgi:hypothetical protein